MESQLAILRSLRAAANTLAQAQAAAAERQRAESAVAQAAYVAEEASAAAMLSRAEAAHEQAQVSLKSVHLGRLLRNADRESDAVAGGDIQGELASAFATIKQSLDELQARAAELRLLRIRRARQRGAVALGISLLVALLVYSVPRLRVEIPYRWGAAALVQGRWERAQGSLRSVLATNPQYKDAQVLLREAYYRPASAALEAGQWEQARLSLRALLQLDPAYRDASTLLNESYWRPIQQAAAAEQDMAAAQDIVQWRAYGPSDARVSGLLSEHAAIRQAASELYAALWAKGRFTEPMSYAGGSTAIRSLAVTQEGHQVAASQEDGKIVLLDAETGLPSESFDAPGVAALGYSLDGRLYAATVRDGELVYYEPGRAAEANVRWAEAPALSDILVDADSGLVTASDRKGRVWFWQIRTGTSLTGVSGHYPGEVHLALSPDGQLLASGGADKMVRLWDAADSTVTRIMRDQPAPITSIAVAPNEEHLATGGADGSVRLLSLTSFREVGSFADGEAAVTALAWHPSGQLLATGDSDGTVVIWNPASTDRPAALSQASGSAVTSLAFSPEGGLLAAGDAAGHVRFWRVQPIEGQVLVALTPTPLPTLTPTPSPTSTSSPTEVPPTPTLTPTPIPEAIVKSKDLNVRSGPGTSYPPIDAVHSGDRLTVLGRDPACGWWQVKLPNSKTGWVSAELVRSTTARCDPPLAPVPTLAPTPTRKPTATPRPTAVATKTPRPTPVPTRAPWTPLTDSTRDFTGSQGANEWSYLWEGYGGRNSFNWREMPSFDGSCWRTNSPEPDIRICYGGEMHPGWGSNIALLWKSSVDGQIRINTQFRKLDTSCGDGIELAVYKGTDRILPHQWIRGNDGGGRSNSVDAQVASGDLIFIVVTIRGESTCDKSQVNAQIFLRQ